VRAVVRLKRAPSRLKAAPPRLRPSPKQALPFYRSPEWRALVGLVTSKRGKVCEQCGASGYVIADHVIELRDGGASLDESNIMLLCSPCHGRKTAQRKRERSGLE
jgi:5-methylcytosine-specific restriction endonuclease McrA